MPKFLAVRLMALLSLAVLLLVALAVNEQAAEPSQTHNQAAVRSALTSGCALPNLTTLVSGNGGRVDWSTDGKTIAFDRQNSNGYFDLWTMDPTGANQTCISCGKPGFSRENNGNPAFDPSGQFIAFQETDTSIKDAFSLLRVITLYKATTNPGAGFRNNLFITKADGSQTWQITHVSSRGGVLHPHFSSDGKKLLWSQMINTKPTPLGTWVMKLAEFLVVNGVPAVSHIQTLTPGDMPFYETHGFSPDGAKIIFTASPDSTSFRHGDIYAYNLATETLVRLTNPLLDQWDEHAHYTPDSKHIVFMSSMGTPHPNNFKTLVQTEFWIMNADGTGKKQLTHFNSPGSPEYIAGNVIASDSSVSPDGTKFIGYIQINPSVAHSGSDVVISLPPKLIGK